MSNLSRRRFFEGSFVAAPALLLIASFLCFTAVAQEQAATITVNAGRVVGKVNPWVLGNNQIGYQLGTYADYVTADQYDGGSGIWDPTQRRSVPEMVALSKNAGLSVARWPGGCAAHRFDWKRTIGLLEQRPKQKFGLPEFLQHCVDIGAEPLITVAEYFGTAQDAADLVEYLNAPDDGKHPWAAKRTADGHRGPWNVVWFEYGNESEHGDHKGRKMTADEYARGFLAHQREMKAVDPRIKLGAVIATGFPKLIEWAQPVLKIAGRQMDFAIHHSYLPHGPNSDTSRLFRDLLAADELIQDYYDQMHALIRATTGRGDMPIAVTEFNGGSTQEKPVPVRHCLSTALVNAEMVRIFMQPQNHIIMANFWQFANEYWGAVKGFAVRGEPLVKRPQYFPFELYHNHFGEQLLDARVKCERYETDGGGSVSPRRGEGNVFQLVGEPVALKGPWQVMECKGVRQRVENGTLIVEFGGQDVNYYHANLSMRADPGTSYRLAGWIKTDALKSDLGGVTFQIGDARGYEATKSVNLGSNVNGTTDWTKVEVDYVTLSDTKAITVTARHVSGHGPIAGHASFRDLSLQKFIPRRFPAVPYLSVNASANRDRTKLFLMVVNKKLDAPIRAAVHLTDFTPRHARAWALTGPSFDATNEKDPNTVTAKERDLGAVEDGFIIEFAPHSLTALEVD